MNKKLLSTFFSKSQSDRIKKNLTSQISLNISSTITQLSFPPLMILFYGLENFGIWIFLTSIPTILNIFNFNLNHGAKTEMSLYFNKNKNYQLEKIFVNTFFLTLLVIIFLVFLSFLLIHYYDFNLKILKDISTNELNIIFFCIFSSFIIKILNIIFQIGISY